MKCGTAERLSNTWCCLVVDERETVSLHFYPVSPEPSRCFRMILVSSLTQFLLKSQLNSKYPKNNRGFPVTQETNLTVTAFCCSGFYQWFCPPKAMLVTVFCAPRDRPETTFALDVSPELELRDFVALCELESGIPAGEILVNWGLKLAASKL